MSALRELTVRQLQRDPAIVHLGIISNRTRPLFFFFLDSFYISTSLSIIWVRRKSRKNNATHSYRSVHYFPVSKQCCGCQCLQFSTCEQMLMHTTAVTRGLYGHRKTVCTGSGLWEKNPSPYRHSNPHQYCAWLFIRSTN